MSNAMASVGAFVNRKFSINRNTGQPRVRRFSIGEPNAATGECPKYAVCSQAHGWLGCLGQADTAAVRELSSESTRFC